MDADRPALVVACTKLNMFDVYRMRCSVLLMYMGEPTYLKQVDLMVHDVDEYRSIFSAVRR